MGARIMTIKVDTITLPAYWASALVNGDFSGLDANEEGECRAMIKDLWRRGLAVVSTADGTAGYAPRFTKHYRLYAPLSAFSAGEVLEYVTHEAVS
jgi:hypothetical protein